MMKEKSEIRTGNKNRKRGSWIKGSYTVEAAFLIPLGIGVLLFVISGALFLHDRIAACAWVHETAVWEGFQKTEEEGRELSPGVLVTKTREETEKKGEEITVTCSGEGRLFSSFVKPLFLLGTMRLEEQEQVKQIYGEQAVRLRGFLEGVYTGGSDLQERTGS